jgi:phosphoribosylformylglycinamidine synthase
VGKYLEVRITETDRNRAEAKVHDMCRELLANPIIEDYRFELEEIG